MTFVRPERLFQIDAGFPFSPWSINPKIAFHIMPYTYTIKVVPYNNNLESALIDAAQVC